LNIDARFPLGTLLAVVFAFTFWADPVVRLKLDTTYDGLTDTTTVRLSRTLRTGGAVKSAV